MGVQVTLGNKEARQFCSSFNTSALAPVNRQNTYFKFSIPLSAFHCPAGYGLDRMDQVSLSCPTHAHLHFASAICNPWLHV